MRVSDPSVRKTNKYLIIVKPVNSSVQCKKRGKIYILKKIKNTGVFYTLTPHWLLRLNAWRFCSQTAQRQGWPLSPRRSSPLALHLGLPLAAQTSPWQGLSSPARDKKTNKLINSLHSNIYHVTDNINHIGVASFLWSLLLWVCCRLVVKTT